MNYFKILTTITIFCGYAGLQASQAQEVKETKEIKAREHKTEAEVWPDSIHTIVQDYVRKTPDEDLGYLTISRSSLLELQELHAIKTKQLAKLQNIADDSITTAYKMQFLRGSCNIYIPQHQLKSPAELQELLKKYAAQGHIVLKNSHKWNDDDWLNIFKTFTWIEEQYRPPSRLPRTIHRVISLDHVNKLLADATSILKSFLPENQDTITFIEKQGWIVKQGLNRLFAYRELQRIINKKGFSHIHLPIKVLMLKNRKTGRYITDEESASKELDNIAVAIFGHFGDGCIDIHPPIDNDYSISIFAQKMHTRGHLSQEALKELKELIKEVPFDLGFDNIFSDAHGDAIIIDTEFKGEPADHCLPKLERYNKTGSPIITEADLSTAI